MPASTDPLAGGNLLAVTDAMVAPTTVRSPAPLRSYRFDRTTHKAMLVYRPRAVRRARLGRNALAQVFVPARVTARLRRQGQRRPRGPA